MNVLYAKVCLYAYPHLPAIAEQIDELVEKKALSSSMNFSPAFDQCMGIIDLTYKKTLLFALQLTIEDALKGFGQKELDHFDYKYFKTRPREHYKDFDSSSRNYFRRQIRYAKSFAKSMDVAGYSDERFEKECLSVDFFREMLKRVKDIEKGNRKNKSAKEKADLSRFLLAAKENAKREKTLNRAERFSASA